MSLGGQQGVLRSTVRSTVRKNLEWGWKIVGVLLPVRYRLPMSGWGYLCTTDPEVQSLPCKDANGEVEE